MPLGPDSPIGFAANPVLGAVMGMDGDISSEMEEYKEQQRERELHLLGTMLFQALMLALCILLYQEWTWSHFNTAYESLLSSMVSQILRSSRILLCLPCYV